jgi:hypothetical protein
VEALQAFAHSTNQKLLILPTDLAGIAGTLGGVSEIVKEVLAAVAPAPRRRSGRRSRRRPA